MQSANPAENYSSPLPNDLKEAIKCRWCGGTGGHTTCEGEDLERVWNPCRQCGGKKVNVHHPLLWLGVAI